MNRQVLCGGFLYQYWFRYLPAGKNTAVYRNPLGVPIFFVKRFHMSYNGHPSLLLHGPYGGTTTTTTRTSTYTGIRYITVPILDVLLLLCFPPTQAIVFPETLSNNKIPKQSRPVEQIKHHYFNCSRKRYIYSYLLNFSSASCRTLRDAGGENYCLL